MTEERTPRDLLVRYLRQRSELGEREWFLERGNAAELLRELAAPPATRSRPGAPAVEPGPGDVELGPDADEFDRLRAEALACTRCRLHESRRTVVFGEGDSGADLMVIGEAPGGEEDRSGRPFVGPAGKLLDKMLAAIGFARAEVFICNVLKCRPPQNRDPLADEVASCNPYLRKQVELVAPKAICAFGRFAAQTVLSSDASLGRLRGVQHEFMGIPVVVTYHPAALLRNSEWKRPAWADLQMLRRIYDEAGGRTPRGDHG